MTDYAINGSSVIIGPTRQQWIPILQGTDHNGQSIYSGHWDVVMDFEGGSVTHVREWLDNVISGSVNLTMLERNSLNFKEYEGVFIEVSRHPDIQTVISSGFTLTVRGVLET
jgi:hypothetical protein